MGMESRKHTKELREDSSAFPLEGIKRVPPHPPQAASTQDADGKEAPYLIHAWYTHSGSLYKRLDGLSVEHIDERPKSSLSLTPRKKETHHESLKYTPKQARLQKRKG